MKIESLSYAQLRASLASGEISQHCFDMEMRYRQRVRDVIDRQTISQYVTDAHPQHDECCPKRFWEAHRLQRLMPR